MVESLNPQVTYSELSMFVRSKVQLHAALGRSNYRLPNVNSAICCMAFLMQVREKTVWCPMAGDITSMRVCFSPPPKTVLLEKLIEAVTAKHQAGEISKDQVKPIENLLTLMKQKSANVEFLVLCIGIFNPQDEIFQKSYVYKRSSKVPAEPVYANEDGMWSNLPHLDVSVLKKTNRMRIPKEQALQLKLQKVQARQQELAAYQEGLQAQMLAMQASKFRLDPVPDAGNPVFFQQQVRNFDR